MAGDHPAILTLDFVLRDAAEQLGVPVTEIAVRSLEARDWPDACLGLPGNGCTEVITPGFRVMLGPPADGVAYRTGPSGTGRREPSSGTEQGDLAVHFSRSGGFTGRERSELHLSTATMPPAEAEELKRLVEEADFWNIPKFIDNGEPIPDGYSYGVSVTADDRNHGVSTYDGAGNGPAAYPGFWVLLGWLSGRTPSQFGDPDLKVAAAG
jgi:hypothetical protein